MLKIKRIKIQIEDTDTFKKKIKEEAGLIESGKLNSFNDECISFQSLNQLRIFLTPKRIQLLKVIRHQKPESIYELAKFVKRTPENVNSDIKLLHNLGFVDISKSNDPRKRVIPEVNYDKMMLEIGI